MNHILVTDVDLVVIITAYLLVFYGETGAGIFAFGQGLFIDIVSTGLLGLHTLLYLTVFLSINLGSRLFDLNSKRGLITLVVLAILLKEVLFAALLDLFSLEIIFSSSWFLSFATSALLTGLIAPFVFYAFNHGTDFFIEEAKEN